MSRGFSLVELSIVLVILGLLTGGILAGQSLIRAAELRAVSTEYGRWTTAMQTFRDKYFNLPGDFTKATDIWGAAHATPATCLTTLGSGTQTCNGNGNGILDFAPAGGNQRTEHFMFWQHLANAGLIEGSYNGRAGAAYEQDCGTTCPRSKLGNGQWFVSNDSSSGAAMFPVAVARHNFRIGGVSAGGWPDTGILKPEEAWNLDTKMDDGRPGTGTATSPISTYKANCVSTSSAATAEYMLTQTGNNCTQYYAAAF